MALMNMDVYGGLSEEMVQLCYNKHEKVGKPNVGDDKILKAYSYNEIGKRTGPGPHIRGPDPVTFFTITLLSSDFKFLYNSM